MGILDGIVEWIAEQVMHGLDLINSSVLGALGCDMAIFLRYFPAASTMYEVFVALAIGLILLFWIWNLFKNFALGLGSEAEDPVKLSIRSVLFILLAYYANEIVDIVLQIGGTPYDWILTSACLNSLLTFGLCNIIYQHKGDIEAAVVLKVNDHFVLRVLIQAAASIFLVKICT